MLSLKSSSKKKGYSFCSTNPARYRFLDHLPSLWEQESKRNSQKQEKENRRIAISHTKLSHIRALILTKHQRRRIKTRTHAHHIRPSSIHHIPRIKSRHPHPPSPCALQRARERAACGIKACACHQACRIATRLK